MSDAAGSDIEAPPPRTAGRRRRLRALRRGARPVPIGFAIVGAQKAATSTLYRMLVDHPQVVGGPDKEIAEWVRDDLDWSDPGLRHDDYLRPAEDEAETLAGDATPAYLYHPEALARMHAFAPDLRLVASLRDPVERACSQWAKNRKNIPSFPDLRECLDRWAERDFDDLPEPWRRTSLLDRGRYGVQLERGLAVYPREQWLVLDFDDVVRRPGETLDAVTDHLGLPRFATHPELLHHNATPPTNTGRPPTLDQLRALVDWYAADLPRAADLSGLDLSGWTTSRVARGEITVEALQHRIVAKLGLHEPVAE